MEQIDSVDNLLLANKQIQLVEILVQSVPDKSDAHFDQIP